MANEKIDTSFESQKPQQKDEGCENVPPASQLDESCSSQNQNVKEKLQLSGRQSTLTPTLKYLNIGNTSTSHSFCSNTPKKGNTSVSVLSENNIRDNYACSELIENFPEITLVDISCNSTINMTNTHDSGPSTPLFSKELKKPWQVLDINLISKLCPPMSPFRGVHDEILPEISFFDDTCDSTVNLTRHGVIPLDCVPETGMPQDSAEKSDIDKISHSTLTPEKSVLVSEKEDATLESSHDCTPQNMPSLESSEILSAKPAKLEISQCSLEKMSATFNGNLTHSISSGSGVSDSLVEDVKKVQLHVTQDISMSSTLDGSKSSSENNTQTINKTQPITEPHPINITRDLSTTNASALCEVSRSSFNSNNVTHDLEGEPVKTSPEEKPSCVSDNKSETNSKTAVSLNNTFTTVQDNAITQASTLQNQTIHLSSSNSSPPMPESHNTNVSTKQVSPESSLVFNDNDLKSSQSCEMQNQTFEKSSLKKSSVSTIVVHTSTTSVSLQNTFENKPNGPITAMGDKSQDMQERASPSLVKNESSAEPGPPEMSCEKMPNPTVSDDRPQEQSFHVNVAAEENSGSSSGEVKDSLNNGHHLYESMIIHNAEGQKANTFILDNSLDFKPDSLVTSTPMPTNKSFNFTVEREECKATGAQKRLYGEGPNKHVAPISLECPSNIVCDRKTFLRQPATRPNVHPLKPPSLLSKFKPASLLPKRPDLLTSGQPTTRQTEALKTNAAHIQTTEMPVSYNLRSTAAAASGFKLPVSSLRKPTSSSMPSGLQRAGQGLKPPQAKGTLAGPSCFDKPAGGTNPNAKNTLQAKKHPLPKTDVLPAAKKKKMDHVLPSSKVEAPATSSDTTSKSKTLKAPTHGQRALPTKPLKHDSSVQSTSSDKTAACEISSRVRTLRPLATCLKAPVTKPQCHDCTKCTLLEAQLKQKDEEIRLLKEELLKCKNDDTVSAGGKN